jgi:hypothetical protein
MADRTAFVQAPRRGGALALAATMALAAAVAGGPVGAAASADAAPIVDKSGVVAKRDAAPTHAWHDAGTRRPLWLDGAWRADFSPALAGRAAQLRPAAGVLKDVSDALQSPVLRDEGGRARALPGGVLVTFAGPADDASARAALAAQGAVPVRRINDRTWLVAAAAGLASLDEANRLADSGAFAAAQPNWWVERVRK